MNGLLAKLPTTTEQRAAMESMGWSVDDQPINGFNVEHWRCPGRCMITLLPLDTAVHGDWNMILPALKVLGLYTPSTVRVVEGYVDDQGFVPEECSDGMRTAFMRVGKEYRGKYIRVTVEELQKPADILEATP